MASVAQENGLSCLSLFAKESGFKFASSTYFQNVKDGDWPKANDLRFTVWGLKALTWSNPRLFIFLC